jgi:hypothetical protein
MIPKKPAPDLIRGGNRFSDQIMRHFLKFARDTADKSTQFAQAVIAFRKPGTQLS